MAQTKVRRRNEVKKLTVPFLSLPFEIRYEIYFLVIRPDCKSGSRLHCEKEHKHRSGSRGSTNLLRLCSQIYAEAVEMLYSQEQSLLVSATEMQVLRNGKDYPRPHEFYMNKATSRCYLPPRLSELEFVRLRKVELILLVPQEGGDLGYSELDCRVARNILFVANTISKTTHLQSVRLSIRHDSFSNWKNWEGHPEKFDALIKLLEAIISKKATLLFGSNYYSDGEEFAPEEDRLLCRIRLLALRLARRAGSDPKLVGQAGFNGPSTSVCLCRARMISHADSLHHDADYDSDSTSEASEDFRYLECEYHSYHNLVGEDQVAITSKTDSGTEGIAGILRQDYRVYDASSEKYKIVPECRKCLKVFDSRDSLHKHIKNHRSHQVRYRYRRENRVNQPVGFSEDRKCWTCGRGYVSIEYLNKHLDKMEHRRHGIVPRYCEDNIEYDQFWARWLIMKGWL